MPLPMQGGMAGIEPMEMDAEADVRGIGNANIPGNHNVTQQSLQVNNPTLDLEQYAGLYTGYARMQRLLYIADHCPSLQIEALNMLINYVKTDTLNVSMYQTAYQKLIAASNDAGIAIPTAMEPNGRNGVGAASGSGGGPDITNELPDGQENGGFGGGGSSSMALEFDQQWLDQATKRGALKTEKLDTDLKHYKSNSIKESIRRGQDDLGDHYLDMGDLSGALKCYSRSRDYCTSGKHIVAMCFNVIKVSIYLQNWSLVLSYVNRAENAPELATPGAPKEPTKSTSVGTTVGKLKVAAGLAELSNRRYKTAAKHFLQVNFDSLNYGEVIAPGNIAQYGALCALASFDRQDLQKMVIHNTGFKQFLELEPWLNEVIRKFNDSEYADCLQRLESERENLMLDIYLASHVSALYSMIRNRGLVQYFSPYLSANMRNMATAFNTNVASLEEELMQLILEGQIKARIDSHNKVLYAKDVDERSSAYEQTLAVGRLMQQRGNALVLRAAIQKAKICVKPPPRGDGSGHSVPTPHHPPQPVIPLPQIVLAANQAPAAPAPAPMAVDGSVTPSTSGQSSPQ